MDKYMKCPRCEINYILERHKMCDVCKAELKLAPDIYSEDDEEMVLCPTCKVNFIFADEEICATCKSKVEVVALDLDVEPEVEAEDEWRSFLDDEKEIPVGSSDTEEETEVVSLNKLHEEEVDELDKEETYDFGGSFDYDDDFDDEEEDEDEDDDE